jgi:hypothetical protein
MLDVGAVVMFIVIEPSPRVFRKAVVSKIHACLRAVGRFPVATAAWLNTRAEVSGTVVEP